MNKPLFKTTIVVWTEYDTSEVELSILARDASFGEAYCAKQECSYVTDVSKDPDWDGTEFFGDDEDANRD